MIAVLYVDDEPDLLELARLFLEEHGDFHIDTLISAREALRLLATTHYDAIISDFLMPEMDGIAFLKELRASGNRTPFIIFTGRGREEVAIEALNNGADFYLQKGGDPKAQFAELVSKLRYAVSRRQAEVALLASEERFRTLTERSSDLIFIIDKDLSPTYISPSVRTIVGYGPEELMGTTPEFAARAVFPEDTGDFADFLSRIRRGAHVENFELHLTRKDGAPVIVSVNAVPFMQDDTFAGAQIAMRDITAVKHTERALLESERTFRTIFENSPYPIAINSLPDYRFLAVNKAFIHSSGFSEEEVLGKSHLELGLLTLTESAKLIARFLASGSRFESVPLALTGKGGKPVHVLFSTIPITFNGRPAVLTMTAEVTQLRRAEQELLGRNRQLQAAETELREKIDELRKNERALLAGEAKFRALVENALDGILITDLAGDLLFVNRTGARMVDLEDFPPVAGRRNVMEFVSPQSKEEVLRDFAAVAGGTDSYLATYKLISGRGREVWIESIGKKIPFEDKDAILISVRDVTERRNAEEELRQSESRFASVFRKNPVPLTLVSLADGRFVDVNDAFLQSTGYSRSDVIGRNSEELGLFADPDEYALLVSAVKSGGHPPGMELRCRTRDGTIHICRFTSGIIITDGSPHALSTIEDITDKKATESAVRALVTGMAGSTGIDSLDRIAESISGWLGADCVMVGEITPDGESVRILSMLLDGTKVPEYSYQLRGTPCEATAEKGFCHYPDNVTGLFPDSPDLKKFAIRGYAGTPLRNRDGRVIGILCILSRKPLAIPQSAREIVDIIAVKAAAEIERAQLERSLRRSRQQLEAAMDIAHLVNWEYEVATGMFTFDDRFFALYGTTAEREGGRTMPAETYAREFIPVEDQNLVAREIRLAILTNDPQFSRQVEHRIIRRDGEVRHILVRYGITKDSAGRTVRTHGANQDITERKRAEEALRESEAKLRRITDHAPDMIYRMALPGGTYEYVSPASVALTGYRPEEFYAEPGLVRRLIHPAWQEYFRVQWEALLKNSVPPVYEYQIVDRQGTVRWFNQRNMLITDEKGGAVAIEGIVTDITRQKTAEQELKKSEERYRAVSENAGSWIWEVDTRGLYVFSSPAVERILGYRPEELVGKKYFHELFDPDIRDDLKDAALAAFERREPFHNFVNVNSHKNGMPVILNTSGTPLFDENGTFTGYCGVDEDITERRKAEEALRRTNHQLGLLTGITRHDILNKITILLGFITIAERKCTDPAVAEYLIKMRDTTTVIRSQIEFTKVYQNLGTHEPQWLELDSVIPHANIPITITLNADLHGIRVFADPMLEKVFFNLLDNSVRHGQRVTTISVTSRRSGGDLLVVWEDNGAGIPEEEKEYIFERGFGKNTGLGLFLVREILALTGISITETGTPGMGARFEILVPKGTYRTDPDRWIPQAP